jgi:hypothetical protein
MALKFVPRGPEYTEDGTTISFRRITQGDLNKFNLENNPFKDRPQEERTEIIKQILEGKFHEIDMTPDESAQSMNQMPIFCVEFVEDIKNLLDHNGTPIIYQELNFEMKKILFDDLYFSNDDFRDFVLAVKDGSKKKFTEVDED